jgi:hypothetical protein
VTCITPWNARIHAFLISPARSRILAFDACAHMQTGVKSACRHANTFSVIFASLGVITNHDRQATNSPTIKMWLGNDVAARETNLKWTLRISALPSRFADECHTPQVMRGISFHIPPLFAQCFRDCGMTIYSQQLAESNTASDVLGKHRVPNFH